MKSILALTLLAMSSSTSAFPALVGMAGMPNLVGRNAAGAGFDHARFERAKRALNLPAPLNITGIKKIPDADHPFIAPGPNDKRGPCPGMNALANHGYIPRNGIITLEQSIHGSQEGFNFAYDVANIFSFLGMWTGGNIEAQMYSIGGPSDLVPPIVGKDGTVLLKPPGMSYSHGRFEGDTSLTRLDWAVKNDSSTFNQRVYDDFVDHANHYGNGKFDKKTIGEYRWTRWANSNKTNKGLVYTPLQAFIGGGASSLFFSCYRNASDVVGRTVSKQNMKYFMGADELKYERFPPNWYRSTECDLVTIVNDSRDLYMMHPTTFRDDYMMTSYMPQTTVSQYACHTLTYLVGQLTPKGNSELDQRLGAALGEWGPYLGGIFATKFGCSLG